MIQQIATLLPFAYIAGAAIPLMIVDFKQHRLPNKIVYPLMLTTIIAQLTLAITQGSWATLGVSLLSGLIVMIAGVLLNFQEWMGMGDAKLMAALTMVLVPLMGFYSMLLLPTSLVAGVVIGLVIQMLKRHIITHIPLGPTILGVFTMFTLLSI